MASLFQLGKIQCNCVGGWADVSVELGGNSLGIEIISEPVIFLQLY